MREDLLKKPGALSGALIGKLTVGSVEAIRFPVAYDCSANKINFHKVYFI